MQVTDILVSCFLCFLRIGCKPVAGAGGVNDGNHGCGESAGGHAEITSIETKTGLDAFMAAGSGGVAMARLNVINGTHWLNLGGGVQDFGLVLGRPPASSSDTTLKQALQKLSQNSESREVIIDYQQDNLMEDIEQSIKSIGEMTNMKIWLFKPLSSSGSEVKATTTMTDTEEEEEQSATTDIYTALRMPRRQFGLDVVFGRVLNEDLLLPFDYDRVKNILEDAFSRKKVDSNELLYLKRKHKTVMRKHRNTFTELYLSNLVHLFDDDNARALSRYRNDPLGNPLRFMPDLQRNNVAYEKSDVSQIENELNRVRGCVILEVRAGVFLHNESLRNLEDLMKTGDSRLRLLVKAEPYDTLDAAKLLTAMKIIGTDRIVTQFPDFLQLEMEKVSPLNSVPSNSIVGGGSAAAAGRDATAGAASGFAHKTNALMINWVVISAAIYYMHHNH